MTVRLSPLQRQVLDQLAHIRVAPEDAWLTTRRLEQIFNTRPEALSGTLTRLHKRDLVEYDRKVRGWRITDAGREALG